MTFSVPRWAPTAWLIDTGRDVPADVRSALVQSLYGTLPIYAGGVLNTIAVALLATLRHPSSAFRFWLALELVVCITRFLVLARDRRAAATGRRTLTDLYVLLGLIWAGSVGYGAYITIMSGDWVSATLAYLSAAAMVGGICFRNFAAPRLVAGMILLSLGPCMVGAVLSGEPILLITLFQIPFYLVAMTMAAIKLNSMLVTTMQAERDNDHRARHDPLTGLANRMGLETEYDRRRAMGGPAGRQAVFYLDLDGFKQVNDTHGHVAGDHLLVAVAERLRSVAVEDMLVSRIGGDEFVLLAAEMEAAATRQLSEAVVTAVADAYEIDGVTMSIGVSVGVAFSRPDETLRMAMHKADRALYASKSAGGGRAIMGALG